MATTGVATDVIVDESTAERLVRDAEPFALFDAVLRGWLRVRSGRGRVLAGSESAAAAWHDRYAVLTHRALFLYRISDVAISDGSGSGGGSRHYAVQRTATVPLLAISAVLLVQQSEHFDWTVECGAGKYRFRASSDAARSRWHSTLDTSRHGVQAATSQLTS